MAEPNLSEIQQFLKTGEFPLRLIGRKNIGIGTKANFKKQATKYTILNGVLISNIENTKKPAWTRHTEINCRPIVKETVNQRSTCMHEGLGSSTEAKAIGGHLDKTLWKLLDSGFWWQG